MIFDTSVQVSLFVAETIGVGALLLLLFRLRRRFGLALLYVTLGGFQHLQTSIAANIAIEFLPGLIISPGSAIMFSSTLFIMLVVYIHEDLAETRSLVYGVVLANLIIGSIVGVLGLHLSSSLTVINPAFNPALLLSNLRVFFAGTIVLVLDVALLIITYELFCRLMHGTYLRVFLSLMVILVFDTFVFVTLAFYPVENYGELIYSGVVGKIVVAAILTLVLQAFLRYFTRIDRRIGPADGENYAFTLTKEVQNVFGLMTYRQRYDLLRERFKRDEMTGLYNRGFFDSNLQLEIDRASNHDHTLSLLLIDIDHFKQINDIYGHSIGDQVIALFANTMHDCFRNADLTCRFGGDEFAVIMPDSDKAAALVLAKRLRNMFEKALQGSNLPLANKVVTFTIGVASFPLDASHGSALFEIADHRLYSGKKKGRNMVVVNSNDQGLEKKLGKRIKM